MVTLQLTQEQLIEVAKALAVIRHCYQQQAEQREDELIRACTAQAAVWHDVELEIWRQYRAAAAKSASLRRGGKR